MECLLDDLVLPVLREHGMDVAWNRSRCTRSLVAGAHRYARWAGHDPPGGA